MLLLVMVFRIVCGELPSSFVQEKGHCARFDFSTIVNNKSIALLENTQLNLTFKVVSSCNQTSLMNNIIMVEKILKNSPQSGRFCQLVHNEGQCEQDPKQHVCLCPIGPGQPYRFIATIDRSYSGTWLWSDISNWIKKEYINLIIRYPPRIENITFLVNGSPKEFLLPNSPATVLCFYKQGYPKTWPKPYLVGASGNLMLATDEVDYIRHDMPVVKCEDSGTVTCKAEGSDQKESALLLVKCEPKFLLEAPAEFYVPYAQKETVSIPFRAYTDNIEKCQLAWLAPVGTEQSADVSLRKGDSQESRQLKDILHCVYSVSGSSPNLTLKLELTDEVTRQSSKWQLQLTNQIGVGYVNFTVFVNVSVPSSARTNTSTAPSHTAEAVDRSKMNTTRLTGDNVANSSQPPLLTSILLGAVGLIFAFIIVVVVIFAVLVKRRGRLADVLPLWNIRPNADRAVAGVVLLANPPALPGTRNSLIAEGEHTYAEIVDAADEDNTTNVSSAPAVEVSEACLRPRPATQNLTDKRVTDVDAEPLYQNTLISQRIVNI